MTHWSRSLGIYSITLFGFSQEICLSPLSRSVIFWDYRRENFKFETSQKLLKPLEEKVVNKRVWSHKWGTAVKSSEPFSCAAHKQFPERSSRDISILVITEICGTSSLTTLVGSVTHLNVCILCFLCLCVHTCRCVFKKHISLITLYSHHFSSRPYQQHMPFQGCWRAHWCAG